MLAFTRCAILVYLRFLYLIVPPNESRYAQLVIFAIFRAGNGRVGRFSDVVRGGLVIIR